MQSVTLKAFHSLINSSLAWQPVSAQAAANKPTAVWTSRWIIIALGPFGYRLYRLDPVK
jgi:hypothetical protein